jgi:hypothetical protein
VNFEEIKLSTTTVIVIRILSLAEAGMKHKELAYCLVAGPFRGLIIESRQRETARRGPTREMKRM